MQENYLIIVENRHCTKLQLNDWETYYLGREQTPNKSIVLSSTLVSRKHARLFMVDGMWFYCDTGNLNGTWYRGEKISAGLGGRRHPVMLRNGDVLQIGEINDPDRVWMLFITQNLNNLNYVAFPGTDRISIGSAENNTLVLRSSCVSPVHARISKDKSDYYVEAGGNSEGTYINGDLILSPVKLNDCDKISVGDYRLIFTGNGFLLYQK